MRFFKYQALGNDYLVLEPGDFGTLTAPVVRRLCDRHFGIGSDGILLGEVTSAVDRFSLRILNPDGSEAEKSGNGLRIFARYLWDTGLVATSRSPWTHWAERCVVTSVTRAVPSSSRWGEPVSTARRSRSPDRDGT